MSFAQLLEQHKYFWRVSNFLDKIFLGLAINRLRCPKCGGVLVRDKDEYNSDRIDALLICGECGEGYLFSQFFPNTRPVCLIALYYLRQEYEYPLFFLRRKIFGVDYKCFLEKYGWTIPIIEHIREKYPKMIKELLNYARLFIGLRMYSPVLFGGDKYPSEKKLLAGRYGNKARKFMSYIEVQIYCLRILEELGIYRLPTSFFKVSFFPIHRKYFGEDDYEFIRHKIRIKRLNLWLAFVFFSIYLRQVLGEEAYGYLFERLRKKFKKFLSEEKKLPRLEGLMRSLLQENEGWKKKISEYADRLRIYLFRKFLFWVYFAYGGKRKITDILREVIVELKKEFFQELQQKYGEDKKADIMLALIFVAFIIVAQKEEFSNKDILTSRSLIDFIYGGKKVGEIAEYIASEIGISLGQELEEYEFASIIQQFFAPKKSGSKEKKKKRVFKPPKQFGILEEIKI